MIPLTEADLPLPMRRRLVRRRRRGWKRPALMAGSAAVLLLAAGYYFRSEPRLAPAASPLRAPMADAPPIVPEIALATDLMPVSREEAERLNSLRGNEVTDLVAAKPFAVRDRFRQDPRFTAALDCLTQAVYYEAGSEQDAGQRAVAQVVLNRVRHPGFPHSVCGVVYQGSELPTGCQFTFTCDGSLLRPPSQDGWARARRIALAALSGWVEAPVGLSTHYHATYVVPYWASALDKAALVGHHIFYTLRGPGGNAAAFRARYDFASEFIPALAALPMQPLEPAGEAAAPPPEEIAGLPGVGLSAHLDVPGGSKPEADRAAPIATEQPALQADRQHGVLTVKGADSTLLAN